MSEKVIIRTTQEIAIKCDLLEQMIELFLFAKRALNGSYEKYESHSEALNLFNLTIRHVEGVVTLARTDLVLLPPAQVAARAAFESAARAAWLVNAADPYEREARWVAHLRGEHEYLSRQAKEIELKGKAASANQKRIDAFKAMGDGVASLLAERGYSKVSAVPNFRELLRTLSEERTYMLYMALSQTTHASHASTWLYRSGGLGTKKIRGEFVSAEDWSLPLDLCRFVFRKPGVLILSQLGADAKPLLEVAN